MKVIKETPVAALEAAESALQEAEQRIGDLRIQRASVIESAAGDFLSEVAKIDAEIAHTTTIATTLRERLVVIERQAAEAAQQQRAAAKKAAIATIAKQVVARQSAAEQLDKVLRQLVAALEAFDAAEQTLFSDWPPELPPAHRYSYLRLHVDCLSSQRKQRMGYGAIRELASKAPYGLTAMTAERNTELVAELEAAPIPENLELVA